MIGVIRKLILKNPQNLNKVSQKIVTDEDIKYAIEKGYEVTDETPKYLLENIYILKLLFKKLNGRKLSFKQLKILYEDDKEIMEKINRNNLDINSLSDEDIDELVVMIGNKVSSFNRLDSLFNNKKILLKYLKNNPNCCILLTNYNFDNFDSDDFEDLYSYIKNYLDSLEDKYYELISEKIIEVIIKHNPKILLDKKISHINENLLIDYIKKYYKEGIITIEELSNSYIINNRYIIDMLIDEDLSNIKYIPKKDNYSLFEKCLDIILSDTNKYIKYFEEVEKKFFPVGSAYYITNSDKIIQALKENNIEIESSNFKFIADDADYIYFLFMRNPNIVNTFHKAFYEYNTLRFTEEQIENIATKIETEHLEVAKIPYTFNNYERIVNAYLKNNPFAIDSKGNIISLELDKLLEYGYILNVNTPYKYLNNIDIILKHLKINFDLINNLNIHCYINNIEQERLLLSILNANGYYITKDSPEWVKTPLTILESLKHNVLSLEDISEWVINKTSFSHYDTNYLLSMYLLQTYGSEKLSQIHITFDDKPEKKDIYNKNIIRKLAFNFDEIRNLSDSVEMDIDDYDLIFRIYLMNYENNKKYYSKEYYFVYNNPYISYYEAITNNKKILNINCLKIVPKLAISFLAKALEGTIDVYADYIPFLYSYFNYNSFQIDVLLKNHPEIIYRGDLLDKNNILSKHTINLIIKNIDLNNITSVDTFTIIYNQCILKNKENTIYMLDRFYYRVKFDSDVNNYIFNQLLDNSIHFIDLTNGEDILSTLIKQLSKEELEKIFIENNNLEFISHIERRYLLNAVLSNDVIREAYQNSISKKLIKTREDVYYLKIDSDIRILFNTDKRTYYVDQEHFDKYRKKLLLMYESGEIDLNNRNIINYIIYLEPSNFEKEKNNEPRKKDQELIVSIFNKGSISDCVCTLSHLSDDEYEVIKDVFKKRFDSLSNDERKTYVEDIAIGLLRLGKNLTEILDINEIFESFYANKKFISESDFITCWLNNGKDKKQILARFHDYGEIGVFEEIIKLDKEILKSHIYNLDENYPINDYVWDNFDKYFEISDIFKYPILFDNQKIKTKYLSDKNSDIWNYFIVNDATDIYFEFIEDEEFKRKLCIISLKNDINSLNYILKIGYYDESILKEIFNSKFIINNDILLKMFNKCGKYVIFLDILADDLHMAGENLDLLENKEYFENRKFLSKIIKIMLTNNFKDFVENIDSSSFQALFNYPEKVVPFALMNNYILNEKTPYRLRIQKEILLNSIKFDPKSIIYSDGRMFLGIEEQDMVKQVIKDNNITYYPDVFYFMLSDFEFIFNSIKYDISNFDKIPVYNISIEDKLKIIEYMKEKIKSGEYKLSYLTPDFMFTDEDILSLANSELPDLVDYALPSSSYESLYALTTLNQNIELNDLINNINSLNVYELIKNTDWSIIYSTSSISKLVDKLIEIKYSSNNDTPLVLYFNSKFTIYCINNNLYVPKNILQMFFTLENIYNLGKLGQEYITAFKKIYNMGYGKKYDYLFNKYKDDTYELILKYGDLLETLIYLPKKEEINNLLISQVSRIYQTDMQKKIVSRLELSDISSLKHLIEKNTSLFDYINSNNVTLELFAFALEKGYSFSTLSNRKILENIEYINLALSKDKFEILEYIDINILPDEQKKYILEKALFNRNLFDNVFNKYENIWNEYYNLSPMVLKNKEYIKYIKNTSLNIINNYIRTSEELLNCFDEKGPRKEILDILLYDSELCIVSFPNYIKELYEEIYKDDIPKIKYINFLNEYGVKLVSYITNESQLYEWFDDKGFRYNNLNENLEVAFIMITLNDEWREKVTDEKLYERLEIILKYRTVFTMIKNIEIKNIIFTKEFFNKLDNIELLKEEDYTQLIIDNLSNIEVFNQKFNEDSLVLLNINSNIFRKILIKMNLYDESKFSEYYKIHKSLNSHQRKLFMSKEVFDNYEKFNVFKVIKYNLKNDFLNSFLEVFTSKEKIELLEKLYSILKDEAGDTLGEGSRLLVRLSYFVNSKYDLFREILERLNKSKDDKFIYNVLCVIYKKLDINTISELDKLNSDNLEKQAEEALTPIDLKNIILSNLIGMNYEIYQTFLERHMDLDTLSKIRVKVETKLKMVYTSNPIDYEYANYLEENLRNIIMFTYVLDSLLSTINSTNDMEQLKKIIQGIIDNDYLAIRKFSLNIMEIVRQIYEIDAQLTLTKISDVIHNVDIDEKVRSKILKRITIDGQEYIYYDLSEYEYALYAHTDHDVASLFDPNFEGHTQLCLSPVSDRGLKGYYDNSGIIYGYDSVPNGGFIASSSTNTGSNEKYNNKIESERDFLDERYDQKEIKESSALFLYGLRSHSETNITRDGMYPSCIIIRGQQPTKAEIDAARILAGYLGLPEGTLAPLIKLQEENTRLPKSKLEYLETSIYAHMDDSRTLSEIHESIELSDATITSLDTIEKLKEAIDKYRQTYKQLESEKITFLRRIKLRTGGSHQLYKCKYNGVDSLVKPGIDGYNDAKHRVYAVKLGSDIQKLINPNSSVDVEVMDVEIDGKIIFCSIIEEKKNTHDFDIVDNSKGKNFPELNDQQMESILRELIVDHLLFNYDTKGVNFLYDSNNVYGIDKEQACKYCSETNGFAGPGIDPTRSSGNGVAFYSVFLQHYKDKIDKNNIERIYTDILEKVESISLLNFYKMYEPYLQSTSLDSTKISSIIERRIRLVSELKEFVLNTFNVIIDYNEKDYTYELDELNNYLNSMGLEGVKNGNTK